MKGFHGMRLPHFGLLALMVLIFATAHAAPRPARLGDSPSTFDALLGKPVDAVTSGPTMTREYQACSTHAPIDYRYTVLFTKNRAFNVVQVACDGHLPNDWRSHAARFLPTDARFTQTRQMAGMRQYLYRSRLLTRTFSGSVCSTFPQARGLAAITESPDRIVFGTAVVACVVMA
jgi:hypothetical protein